MLLIFKWNSINLPETKTQWSYFIWSYILIYTFGKHLLIRVAFWNIGSELEKLFRHIGFIRYDSLPVWDCVIHLAPEVIAMFASFFVYVVCDRLNPKNPDGDTVEQGLLASMTQPPETSSDVQRSLVQKKALIALTIIGNYSTLSYHFF